MRKLNATIGGKYNTRTHTHTNLAADPYCAGTVWRQQQVEDVVLRARKLVPAFDKTQGCLLPQDN